MGNYSWSVRRWVKSKSFCFILSYESKFRATLFTVSLGSATLNDDDPNRVTVATSTYYLHPDYNPQTLENDIGIIRLRMPITHTGIFYYI